MKKNGFVSLVCMFLLIFIISAVMIVNHYTQAKSQEELYDNLAEIVDTVETSENTESSQPEESESVAMLSEYATLYEQNSDMVGWIKIEDTKINYPVMQSIDNPNFYLKHGFDKAYTDYGCPYVGENCDIETSDNLVIYGHNMKNGSMFSNLNKYKDKSFYETHKTISFDTLTEKQTYEIIAVFKTVVYTDSADEFRYYQFANAENEADFMEYVSNCKERSFYDTGVTAEYGDRLITLSTCEYSNANGRLVVVAKKVTESGGINAPTNDGATEIPS